MTVWLFDLCPHPGQLHSSWAIIKFQVAFFYFVSYMPWYPPFIHSVCDKREYPRAAYLVQTFYSCRGCIDASQVSRYTLEPHEVTSRSNSKKRTRRDQDGVQNYNKHKKTTVSNPRESKIETEGSSDAIPWSHLVVDLCQKNTHLFVVIHVGVQLSIGHLGHG